MNSQDYRNLQEAYLNVYENEQLDELSVNKMHDYINKAEKDRDRLNKKWDQGTATSKERKKVFDREEGEARASKKIRQKTGKDSFRLNALDKLKSAITKEEVDLFDTILEYLVAEGYADTNESALVIMSNMSEEWRQSIVEATYKPSRSVAPTDTPVDTRKVVTRADKSGNTLAYQNYKKGDKRYKAADHLGEGVCDLDSEKGDLSIVEVKSVLLQLHL